MGSPKKRDIVRTLSRTRALLSIAGEIHFILREEAAGNQFGLFLYSDEAEAMNVLKREASKPLLLVRSE